MERCAVKGGSIQSVWLNPIAAFQIKVGLQSRAQGRPKTPSEAGLPPGSGQMARPALCADSGQLVMKSLAGHQVLIPRG